MSDFNKRLLQLSSINISTVDKLNDIIQLIHSDDLYLSKLESEDNIYCIDTFEGLILITIEDDNVLYKFIPNERFNKVIIKTLKYNKSLLTESMCNKLVKVFNNIYNELI